MESTGQNPLQKNQTTSTKLILLGFPDVPHLQGFLFGLFLTMYIVILTGNSLIIILTKIDPSLPKLLIDLCRKNRVISFLGCYVFLILGVTECFILTVMAYDRYVAICNPLLYSLVMNNRLCLQVAAACWVSGIPVHIAFTYSIFSLPFCGHQQLNHFFCDIPPVLALVCGDMFMVEILIYAIALIVVTTPSVLILMSYVKILSTILKLPSATGHANAFSTCSSHLTVVALFFGSSAITYLKPKSSHSARADKFLSLFYTIVTPMFNPIIYCLRNKDVMVALRNFLLK
uniref:Olfactory receptor n=1 Tax=Chinchilla lanigera TaxID=34839 RepID=A0A8C2UVV8_CHILA